LSVKTMVVIPTRGRPQQCRKLSHLLDEDEVSHVFCVDDDDPFLGEYLTSDIPMFFGPSKRLGPWLNYAAEAYKNSYDIIGFIGDDVIPRSKGWLQKVEDAMVPDGLVYCNDGWQGEGLPTSVFMDSHLIKRLGYMVYPELTHLYIDNHWKALGEHLGTLRYLPDVYLEHMHPFAGKASSDETYEKANSDEMYHKDGAAFTKFLLEELPNL
jgi:hypothetical protein